MGYLKMKRAKMFDCCNNLCYNLLHENNNEHITTGVVGR